MTRVTTHSLRAQKAAGDKICMLTAYDATFARLLDDSGIDILLVGDSLGMVIQGHDTTLPVTMEDIIYHCRAVVRATRRAQVVGDMPFMSYQESLEQGVRNAGRLMKEGGCHAVKLEGGAQHAALVARMTATGIPVMGHIGLTPQSVHQFGGFKVQGKGADAVAKLTADARALEDAGAYAIVLEGIPAEVAREVTAALTIPTIGIGAGVGCDGQVLVIYDLLGMDERFKPKFVRRYANLATTIREATGRYVADVKGGAFPADAESFLRDKDAGAPTPLYSSAKK
ncbi:MAG: 3-methyl-2-oxobutanoate hydroxymethyltransferase [Myxococcales bacterium]|nr:3-methyl-2-oxobutanoate hydroxymethyltransferase [Myxococcales bacterium]MBK7193622.1 3-methyl-2-oxobutanoate hydroxymethyltransferase [Myxococcales bacterium]MBP6844542.1 3-methyl-2-oxobutanoate hydroxymethyltransferase [Kofleriaceae bacterium]